MRRFIVASHHKLAYGMKDTLQFLTNYSKAANDIIDINAYSEEGEDDITDKVDKIFASFDPKDEVIVLTDMMGGSVNQKFYNHMNDHVHVICGFNLPLAMSLLLQPEEEKLNSLQVEKIVSECQKQLIYVNDINNNIDDEDE